MEEVVILQSAKAWHVRVPLLAEWASSPEYGPHAVADRLLLKLSSPDGLAGWGEMALPAESIIAPAMHRLVQVDFDNEPQSLLPLWEPDALYWSRPEGHPQFGPKKEMLRHRLRHPMQSAVETALADLRARRLGIPLHLLYGGAWRKTVAVDYWMGRVSPEQAARCARRARELGFHGLKLKTTLQDPNVERLKAIRDAAGADFSVTVDPNGRFYRLDDAWSTIAAMEEVGNMAILEDPFPRFYLNEFALLRQRLGKARLVVHVDPNESLWSVLQSGAAGGLNLDSYTCGPAQWQIDAGTADRANLPVWHGSSLNLGIATALELHTAASSPNCTLPGDQASPWLREHMLVKTGFEIRDGGILVPTDGPGLGIVVDEEAVARHTICHWTA